MKPNPFAWIAALFRKMRGPTVAEEIARGEADARKFLAEGPTLLAINRHINAATASSLFGNPASRAYDLAYRRVLDQHLTAYLRNLEQGRKP